MPFPRGAASFEFAQLERQSLDFRRAQFIGRTRERFRSACLQFDFLRVTRPDFFQKFLFLRTQLSGRRVPVHVQAIADPREFRFQPFDFRRQTCVFRRFSCRIESLFDFSFFPAQFGDLSPKLVAVRENGLPRVRIAFRGPFPRRARAQSAEQRNDAQPQNA